MTIKSVVKDLLPPIFFKALRRIANRRPAPIYGFVGEYPSFEAALAASTSYETDAYANPSAERLKKLLSEPLPRKIDERFIQVHSALSFISRTENARRFSVLDVGGGNGAYAVMMKRLLPDMALDWTVLETRLVADACAAVRDAPCRYSADAAGETFDVVLISGTLQYLPHLIAALQEYSRQARWIILTRVPIVDTPNDKVTLQIVPPHLHEGSMPVWLFSDLLLEAAIGEIGTIVAEWEISPDAGMCAMVGARPVGYLIRTRARP